MSSVEPEDRANQLDGGKERAGELVVAGSDGAEVFEFVEEPFDKVRSRYRAKSVSRGSTRLALEGMTGTIPRCSRVSIKASAS